MSLVSRSNLQFHESAAWLIVDRVRKKRDMQTIAGFSVLEKRKCLEEGQRRMNSRFPVLCRAVTLGPRKDIVRDNSQDGYPLLPRNYCPRTIGTTQTTKLLDDRGPAAFEGKRSNESLVVTVLAYDHGTVGRATTKNP